MHSTQLLGKNTMPWPWPWAWFCNHGRDSVGSKIMTVGGVISVVETVWSMGETVVKRGKWRGQRKKGEMLSTITSVISGRTKICDIDMLLIVRTSPLFNNVMQTIHELMTLLPLHWANITLHLDLVFVVILLMILVLKKSNYWFYMDLQGHIYVHVNWFIARVSVSFH